MSRILSCFANSGSRRPGKHKEPTLWFQAHVYVVFWAPSMFSSSAHQRWLRVPAIGLTRQAGHQRSGSAATPMDPGHSNRENNIFGEAVANENLYDLVYHNPRNSSSTVYVYMYIASSRIITINGLYSKRPPRSRHRLDRLAAPSNFKIPNTI